jgi:hypothetical protein
MCFPIISIFSKPSSTPRSATLPSVTRHPQSVVCLVSLRPYLARICIRPTEHVIMAHHHNAPNRPPDEGKNSGDLKLYSSDTATPSVSHSSYDVEKGKEYMHSQEKRKSIFDYQIAGRGRLKLSCPLSRLPRWEWYSRLWGCSEISENPTSVTAWDSCFAYRLVTSSSRVEGITELGVGG